MFQSFRKAVAEARQDGELYFAGLLSEDRILDAFGDARLLWRGWIYTPTVTLWVFLSQCLSSDHSCRDAVARLIAWRVARGKKPCSAETGRTAQRGPICQKKHFAGWSTTPVTSWKTRRLTLGFGMGDVPRPFPGFPHACAGMTGEKTDRSSFMIP